VFISLPFEQSGFTRENSLSAGVLWGKVFHQKATLELLLYKGFTHHPLLFLMGKLWIPVPGIEFERLWSSSAVVYYLGIAPGPEVGLYEEPSYSIRLWHFRFP